MPTSSLPFVVVDCGNLAQVHKSLHLMSHIPVAPSEYPIFWLSTALVACTALTYNNKVMRYNIP